MKLSERWPKYAYGHIAVHNFFKYGSESYRAQKLFGDNIPRVRKFHGAKVLGTFAPEE